MLWILSLPISPCSSESSTFSSSGSFLSSFKYARFLYLKTGTIFELSKLYSASVGGLYSLEQFVFRLFELAKIALFYFLTFHLNLSSLHYDTVGKKANETAFARINNELFFFLKPSGDFPIKQTTFVLQQVNSKKKTEKKSNYSKRDFRNILTNFNA